ncbi:MAG: hypothetical protein NBKEAIPA_01329 [Nitrospirae bacterium]|nr:hypothetical protein [Nitrospirota bacterium]MCE7965085.1 hypothetical protein [Nitrospira sp. NTP2]MCK6493703.1 hypothetical protein [Nitrospira sp.]MEB2337667.1 hypothetical protein [Nitrospirales bacterium]QOJ33542.1 MAG: hypothetical protein HRU82_00625 [Nitrospira sp.]
MRRNPFAGRQRSISPTIVRASSAVVFAVTLLTSLPADAKIYRCEGPNGSTLLTDQPKGKQNCVVINTATPSLPGGFTPPREASSFPPPQLPPDAVPPAAQLTAPRPSMPGESNFTPPPQTEPQAQAAPEAQHCSPRVNPLNPFAGMNCPPQSGETKKP